MVNRGRRGQSGRGRGSSPRSTSRPPSTREYPRTARVNELLREILAEELERIGDPRLEWVSITGVTVNQELSNATVFFSGLDGVDGDPLALEALSERRVRLQAAIGRQARLRRTPELHFQPDPGVRAGWRVEEILREIGPFEDTDEADEPDEADVAGTVGEAGGADIERFEGRDGTASGTTD